MTDDSDRGAVGSVAIVVASALLVATVVTGLVASAGGMGMLTGPSGDAILDDAEQQYDSADTVVGSATVTVANETTTDTAQVSFAVTDDNESRVSITGDNGTTVVGSNGTVAWVHDEETGLTRILNDSTADGQQLNESQNESARAALDRFRTAAFDWTEENTTATRVGTETVGGSEAYVVEVESTNESRTGTVTVWVDTDSSVVQKQQYTDENGTVTVRYTETRFNVSVADSTFQPPSATPDGTRTVETFEQLQTATSLTVPAADATFTEGYVANDGATGVARYTAPNVTVVASTTPVPFAADNTTQVTIDGVTANVTTQDGRTVVVWESDDTTIAVITEEDRDVALTVAQQLVADSQQRLATPLQLPA